MKRAFVVFVLALAGCGGDEGGGLSAQEVVARTVEATGEVESFHFKLEVVNPPRSLVGLNLTFAEGDVRVPDRLRADIAGTFTGISLESEIVTVGRDDYLRDPFSGKWRKIDIGVSPLDLFDRETGVLAVLEAARDIELAEEGDEYVVTGDVGARGVEKFLGVDADERELDVEVRVGKDDLVLRRLAVTGPANESEPEDVERIIELSRFGQDVEIEAPA